MPEINLDRPDATLRSEGLFYRSVNTTFKPTAV